MSAQEQRNGPRLVSIAIVLIAAQFLQVFSAFAAAPSKYVVGYATYTARIVPLWLAQEQGFFAKYGIEVDPVFIRGAPTLVAGLAAGSIHIGRTGGSAMLPSPLDMNSNSSPLLTRATPMTSSSVPTSSAPRTCAAKLSVSPASAAPAGWA